eukprot:349878-Pyramimonas_sp.AAC.1
MALPQRSRPTREDFSNGGAELRSARARLICLGGGPTGICLSTQIAIGLQGVGLVRRTWKLTRAALQASWG